MFSAFTYIIIVHCQTPFDLFFSIIMNCVTYSVLYENLTCSISTRLDSPGKTWKMDVNGPGKSWKTHIKRSWKVMENHCQCSVRTLYYCYCFQFLLNWPAFLHYSRLGRSQEVYFEEFFGRFFLENGCQCPLSTISSVINRE